MEKYKLKKIKITRFQRQCLIIAILCGIMAFLLKPINLSEKLVNNAPPKDYKTIIAPFNFNGQLEMQNIFASKYISLLYKNEGKYEGHFINLKDNREINLDSFIKANKYREFSDKIHTLLINKYPAKIVNILENLKNKAYVFTDQELIIYYNITDEIETKREFNLRVNYNEINQFLTFEVNGNGEYNIESGFVYDPAKISVAFTFDDGPNKDKTVTLINALEDYKMSATFFMVANKLENDQETVKKVYNSHSEIGYHSLTHSYFTKQTSEEIKEEFAYSDGMLNQITGGHFLLTRPPYGAYNANTLNAIDNVFIRWNLDTNDWRYKDVDYIKNYVLTNLTDGSIILFHDSYATSVKAATELFEILYLQDIQVMSVSMLAKLKNISLENHKVYYDFK